MDIMNFVYDRESGMTKTELHKVEELDEKTAIKCFEAEQEKPLYMIIRFHGMLERDDLELLYITCLRHGLFSIEDVEKEIEEDLERQPIGQWDITCYNFKEAFEAAMELVSRWTEDKWSITIMEEPPYSIKKRTEGRES